jgi:hypothetical protein
LPAETVLKARIAKLLARRISVEKVKSGRYSVDVAKLLQETIRKSGREKGSTEPSPKKRQTNKGASVTDTCTFMYSK